MSANRHGRAAAAVSAALLLAGCSQSALAPDEFADARAVLDRTAQRIELPLDRYLMSDSEMRIVEHANAILIDECMEDAGFDYPAADGDWAAIAPTSERPYGLWSVESASQYGYDLPADPALEAISASGAYMTPDWSSELNACYGSTEQLPLLVSGIVDADASRITAASSRGESEAYLAATADPQWKAAREEWWDCLRDEGLVPQTGDADWGPPVPAEREEQIRVAIIDASCKEETDLVQRLGDVEARFQAAFIASEEAALREQRDEVDVVLREARAIVGAG